jgi:hypothetical protein
MRKVAVLKAFYQESIWLAVNLFGVVYYVVKTRQFLTPDYAVAPNPFSFGDTVIPIFEFFLYNQPHLGGDRHLLHFPGPQNSQQFSTDVVCMYPVERNLSLHPLSHRPGD